MRFALLIFPLIRRVRRDFERRIRLLDRQRHLHLRHHAYVLALLGIELPGSGEVGLPGRECDQSCQTDC